MGNERFRPKRLGEKLRQIRLALGLSQTEMVKHLGLEEAIWYTQISSYELGRRDPPLTILLQYARAAKVSTDVLIDDNLDLPARLLNKAQQSRR
ncbi:MAG TPA: helix-turn-helix transcriptional regulator [Pyrinomonadaceae bacterium]|nr:helix-turn-helix transcriptional regulator [Pyrinomonadaceae bacterium]